jgi:uncharacterized caspase-like protein
MNLLLRGASVLVACLLSIAGDVAAQASASRQGERVALVIGNSSYKEAPLPNPVNDASDMARELERLGFTVILRRNAGQRDMRAAIRDFSAQLRRAHTGLFYFAGHGLQVRGSNYLVPVGADIHNEADAEDLSIDANYVLRTMEEAQVKVGIVILDACRNNPFARGFRSPSRGLAQMSAATGSVIAFATAPGSVASDGAGRNGTYTKHLLENLRHPDTDILKVFQRTRAGVVKETAGRQTPWESTSLIGDFHFRVDANVTVSVQPAAAAPASVPAVDHGADERLFWESVKDSKNPAELKAYLERYPEGAYASIAKARLAPAAKPAADPAINRDNMLASLKGTWCWSTGATTGKSRFEGNRLEIWVTSLLGGSNTGTVTVLNDRQFQVDLANGYTHIYEWLDRDRIHIPSLGGSPAQRCAG